MPETTLTATTAPADRSAPCSCGFLNTSAALAPVLLIAALLTCYLLAPQFYLTWVLSALEREYQVVELLTFGAAALGGLLLLLSAWQLRSIEHRLTAAPPAWRSGAALLGLLALATLFFAAEEISWGQTYLGWATPDGYAEFSGETNLHNADLPFSLQGLGSLGLAGLFFGLPLAWRLKWLPASWAPAIPETGVTIAAAVAFLWKEVKTLYLLVGSKETTFYLQFLEQLNEHKEMLLAVTLLAYGLLRLRAVQQLKHRSHTP